MTLIAGAEQPHRGVGLLLDTPPLQNLGTLSYSWYLWHWPFLVFAAALFPNISVTGKLAAGVASLIVASITHQVIENPIRSFPYLIQRPALTLYLAAGVTVCSLSAAYVSMRWAAHLTNTPEMMTIEKSVDDIANMPRQQCVTLGESSEIKRCEFGNTSSATNVVLFGDSHAIQWFNPLLKIANAQGWKLTTIVKSGCPAADVRIPGSNEGFAAHCAAWRTESIRQIGSLHPSMVVIGNVLQVIRSDEPMRPQANMA